MTIKIHLIGGSGFIGSSLSDFLSNQNYDFDILDIVKASRYADKVKIVDVRNVDKLRLNLTPGSILVNLAAEHSDNVMPISLYYDVNVAGAVNVCNVAREKKINKIIFTSSVAIYKRADTEIYESSEICPSNDYGRSKYQAELVYKAWQEEDPKTRTLVIIRPTVVFGENNRGNVYNLMKNLIEGKFVMVGSGNNIKSISYVGNLVSFIEYCIKKFDIGVYVINYSDKPDWSMQEFITFVSDYYIKNSDQIDSESFLKKIRRGLISRIKLPYLMGIILGLFFDLLSMFLKKKFVISSIRVQKFCSNSIFGSEVDKTEFYPAFSLKESIARTIKYEFINKS